MNRDAEGMQTAHHLQLIRRAVARGHGQEALRLANEHKIPNALRLDLGVELSDDPNEVPEVHIG